MKLRGIEVSETVCGLFNCGRLAEVTGKAFPVVSFILPCIWHVGCDIYQTDKWCSRPGFSNDRSAITMSHKNAWAILLCEDALRGSHIFFKGCLRLLDDAHVVSILD